MNERLSEAGRSVKDAAVEIGVAASTGYTWLRQAKFTKAITSEPGRIRFAQLLEKYPDLHASRLYQMMCDRGYPGRSDGHFRRQIARIRPRKLPEPFARLDMPAGEQAQMDWGHFGKVAVGRAMRRLCAHLVTLSWSRMVFLQFFYEMQMPCFRWVSI
jgi:hypothetical protein